MGDAERKPTEEELQLMEIMLKLPPEKQELWFIAWNTIREYENEIWRDNLMALPNQNHNLSTVKLLSNHLLGI